MALTDLHRGFRDDAQRRRAAELVLSRLGDERRQAELHSLLQFTAQLSDERAGIDEAWLAEALPGVKLIVVEALIRAVRASPQAVDHWIAVTSRPGPLLPPEPVLDGTVLPAHHGDLHRAAAHYRLVSETGDVHALYALGCVYWTLDQQEKARSDEHFWMPAWRITEVWQHAADLGSVEAMYAVAMMQDPGSRMALRYLRQAAAHDHPAACYALGYEAVQRGDRNEALMWWTRAAEAGHEPAIAAIPLLEIYSVEGESDPM
ncbi:hypothetical protein Aab01nite_52740 [Paractinoplanes abujensis]|uniref:Sel1 repeat family protein n=1 Tax=Paractinoplanes abujensis TaxID=882441 RepID=A0A7W7CS46_9ACTN|nr:sel1 repeat family protein [Actinoplanes abujensis]MBB4693658.1 hypothetical protein [Actinoplanes abujensis]GID21684.1 hypothetical protein Aab01nite_52740 [Actinoplanes abujensis]